MPRVWSIVAATGMLAALVIAGPVVVQASDKKDRTSEERRHDRARVLRERSTDAARSRIGYPSVDGPITTTEPDTYYVLSLQIERLAGMIQALRRAEAQRKAAPAGLGAVPSSPVTAPLSDVKTVYGPAGPTEKSVRLLLEYRLMIAGNPRLKIGRVADAGEAITAQVVTVDGSVVEEYKVSKKTGVWQPVR